MYQSIPKPPIPPPPRAKPGAFDFFEKFWSNSPLCGLFRRSNVPPIRASKRVKSPTPRHVKATVQNFFPYEKPFIQMYIFCNKQLAAVWFKICVNCNFNDNRVICYIKTQLKYPKSLKAILRRFLISLKMLFLESPHSMGFLKGSQMLQQNCEHIK